MEPIITFEELVSELKNIIPWVTCADEGTSCFYCGGEPGWYNKPEKHEPDCLWVRIQKIS